MRPSMNCSNLRAPGATARTTFARREWETVHAHLGPWGQAQTHCCSRNVRDATTRRCRRRGDSSSYSTRTGGAVACARPLRLGTSRPASAGPPRQAHAAVAATKRAHSLPDRRRGRARLRTDLGGLGKDVLPQVPAERVRAPAAVPLADLRRRLARVSEESARQGRGPAPSRAVATARTVSRSSRAAASRQAAPKLYGWPSRRAWFSRSTHAACAGGARREHGRRRVSQSDARHPPPSRAPATDIVHHARVHVQQRRHHRLALLTQAQRASSAPHASAHRRYLARRGAPRRTPANEDACETLSIDVASMDAFGS